MTTLSGPPIESVDRFGALTLGGFLFEVSERYRANEALVFDDPLRGGETVRWRYEDLEREARRIAAALVSGGVNKGARVGILMGNRPEAVASIFGAGLAGAVAVPISTFSSANELDFIIRHADLEVLLTQTSLLKHEYVKTLLGLCPELAEYEPGKIRSAHFPYLARITCLGLEERLGAIDSWQSFLASGDGIPPSLIDARNENVHPSDYGVIIYSSGTTSTPKGILHTHRAAVMQFWNHGRIFCRTPDTRMWTPFPLFWTAGLNTAMGGLMAKGGCWVMQEAFEPGAALKLIARERVTDAYTSMPPQIGALTDHPDWPVADLSSLRCVGGRPEFKRHPSVTNPDPNWHMVSGYGMTETCASIITHFADTPPEEIKASHGRLLPGAMLRITDPDTGAVLAPGEEGEICLKGPTVMERYVKMNREDCFDVDGFLHTGDSGWFDENGYVHWTGRMTDMIKTGGANVSPAEIEATLRGFKGLKLARAVGVPDNKLGEMVVLCAVPMTGETVTEEDIKTFLKERIASYKVPKKVLFMAEGDIPIVKSGAKVKDKELRKLAAELIAGEA